jgi:uncharacterized protein
VSNRAVSNGMPLRHLTPADYTGVPWKNGGGVSTTIAGARLPGSAAGDWSGVIWQLGRTQIAAPAPFSDLSGFERLQAVIGGHGLVLETPTGEIDLREPFRPVRYDGGTPIISRLENGPVEVINLMARRDLTSITLVMLDAQANLVLQAAHHIVYAPLSGTRICLNNTEHDLPKDHAIAFDGEASIRGIARMAIVASIGRR